MHGSKKIIAIDRSLLHKVEAFCLEKVLNNYRAEFLLYSDQDQD